MKNKICLGCLREIPLNEARCPYCGFDPLKMQNPRYLQVGIRLNKRYIVGKALGEGGFGITYVGYDELKKQPVAIKEYFPSAFSSRDMSLGRSKDVRVFDGKGNERYLAGLQRFENEANALKKHDYYRHIVQVRDYFEENNTGYIIMEYVPGLTLSEWIEKNGKMDCEEAVSLLLPLIKDIAKLHQRGLLHRDISPDNIILRPDGILKLIDFGSARSISIDTQKQEHSMTVIVRQQYAPKEQYIRRGNQGAWTDVYSLTATMYYLLTAATPPPALEREVSSVNNGFLELLRELPDSIAGIIENGMAADTGERYQSMDELALAIEDTGILHSKAIVQDRTLYYDREKEGRRVLNLRVKRRIRIAVAAFVTVFLISGIVFNFGIKNIDRQYIIVEVTQQPQPQATVYTSVMTAVPALSDIIQDDKKPEVKNTKKPKPTARPKPTPKPKATAKPVQTKKPVPTEKAKAAKKAKKNEGIRIITD